ncbi:MAG: hypothetical protein HC811_00325 [Flammeovirgaceae bacterium]|nr:hypothetical protein [Flammeovirgaceae bacterium]
MKKILSILSTVLLVTTFWSCGDDPIPDAPSIVAPEAFSALVGEPTDIVFTVTVPGGYKSSTVVSNVGTATVSTEPALGATSGDVVVEFSSSSNALATITLTVMDDNNKSTSSSVAVDVSNTASVTSDITANTVWTTGNIYILTKRITVTNGATLTIQPGVIVKGEAGTEANASALLIAQGAKIMAEGTVSQPIIFTSVSDEIQPGQLESPNLLPTVSGLWGGLIVLGKAKISVSTNAATAQIEGIPPSDTNGLYGGSDDADNSGVLQYVSIRHGGSNIGDGNEINGLTLGGVGSGTVIQNIEVVANQDDGIEFFGGTVSVTNALVWNAGDDAIDTDQAWAGTLDNFIVIAGTETDHCLEIDGPEGSYNNAANTHVVKNGSVKGITNAELADYRSCARGSFQNIYFFNFPDPATPDGSGGTLGRGDLSLSNPTSSTCTTDNFANGNLSFSGLQITLGQKFDNTGPISITAVFKSGTSAHATNVASGANTVGANKTLYTWTWASLDGELGDF